MSDPVACLALSMMPIIAGWNANDERDEDSTIQQQRGGSKEEEPLRNPNSFLRKLFVCGEKLDKEDWWYCVTMPCRPCSSDVFFQLDQGGDDGVEDDQTEDQ